MGKKCETTQEILNRTPQRAVVMQINQCCRTKNAYFCPTPGLKDAIWSKVESKSPKSVLVVDEPTLDVLGELKGAKVTLALTETRTPDSCFVAVKTLLVAYLAKYKPGLDVEIVRLKDILEAE